MKFNGFVCDAEDCSNVHPDSVKVVEKVSLRGPGVNVESTKDLCPDCGARRSQELRGLPGFKEKPIKGSPAPKPKAGSTSSNQAPPGVGTL